jgi:ubiquinone/menaquinone biosynthesis C-methylase UbiE
LSPTKKIDEFKESYFEVKTPLVSKLFKKRIRIAVEIASIKENYVVLDVGCHTGYLLKFIHFLNPLTKLYGIDNDPYGPSNTKIENCELQTADVRKIPFDEKYFDVIFAMDVLEHVENDLDMAINEIGRVLKPEGIVILSGPTESWFYSLCRFFYIGKFRYAGHKRTVYDIEKMFESSGFQLIEKRSLPGFPLPPLFRITKFKKTVERNT